MIDIEPQVKTKKRSEDATSISDKSRSSTYTKLDYSLTEENANRAIELGLAEADWYQSPVKRAVELLPLLAHKS